MAFVGDVGCYFALSRPSCRIVDSVHTNVKVLVQMYLVALLHLRTTRKLGIYYQNIAETVVGTVILNISHENVWHCEKNLSSIVRNVQWIHI